MQYQNNSQNPKSIVKRKKSFGFTNYYLVKIRGGLARFTLQVEIQVKAKSFLSQCDNWPGDHRTRSWQLVAFSVPVNKISIEDVRFEWTRSDSFLWYRSLFWFDAHFPISNLRIHGGAF
jgi:hypothetical protein